MCQLCGQAIDSPGLCPSCRHRPLAIDGIRSAFIFEGGVRQAIHELKYRHHHALAATLAGLMAEHWRFNPLPADVLVAVPLHPARLRERGYNQAELLAHALGGMIGLPVMASGLRRVRHTRPQMSLDAADRRGNVQAAFHYQPGERGDGNAARGQRVLVVDDVCTTGSTLEACSLALKAAGASSVWGFTLARA
jgi:ComF family protein